MCESPREDFEVLRRLSHAAKASRRRHADTCEARDEEIWRLMDLAGKKVADVAREAEMSPSHITKIAAEQAARRQSVAVR